uniref:Uncharacterized protein n=1 Tax=Chenopodium quinoa TaxID=63459 RepID=A0A803LSL2_CHEQI
MVSAASLGGRALLLYSAVGVKLNLAYCLRQVMATVTPTIGIPFQPIVEQIANCVGLEKPVYVIDDFPSNKAAEKAIRGLMDLFIVAVDDFIADRIRTYKRCATLFRMQRHQLRLGHGTAAEQSVAKKVIYLLFYNYNFSIVDANSGRHSIKCALSMLEKEKALTEEIVVPRPPKKCIVRLSFGAFSTSAAGSGKFIQSVLRELETVFKRKKAEFRKQKLKQLSLLPTNKKQKPAATRKSKRNQVFLDADVSSVGASSIQYNTKRLKALKVGIILSELNDGIPDIVRNAKHSQTNGKGTKKKPEADSEIHLQQEVCPLETIENVKDLLAEEEAKIAQIMLPHHVMMPFDESEDAINGPINFVFPEVKMANYNESMAQTSAQIKVLSKPMTDQVSATTVRNVVAFNILEKVQKVVQISSAMDSLVATDLNNAKDYIDNSIEKEFAANAGSSGAAAVDAGSLGVAADAGSLGAVVDAGSSGAAADVGSSGAVADAGSSGAAADVGSSGAIVAEEKISEKKKKRIKVVATKGKGKKVEKRVKEKHNVKFEDPDGEDAIDEVQGSKCVVYGTLRNRMLPSSVVNVCKEFSEDQLIAIRAIGFGSLEFLKVSQLPLQLGFWLVKHFDAHSCTLNIPDSELFKITEQHVHEVLGLPARGIEMDANAFSKDDKVINQWKKQFPKNSLSVNIGELSM